MKHASRKALWAVTLAAAALVTACGGDSDDNASTPPPADPAAIPQSVTTSVASLLQYAMQSLGLTSETTEPSAMVEGNLATDDTAEPGTI
jgi:hypothetical protein